VDRGSPFAAPRRAGFTLIEILAVLFILVVVVTITAQVLRETRRGAARAAENEAASYAAANALDTLRRDLSRAVGGGTFTFCAEPDNHITNQTCHELYFVALTESASTASRAMSCVYYWIETTGTHDHGYSFVSNGLSVCGDLIRVIEPIPATPDPLSPYHATNWFFTNSLSATEEVVARHVTRFNILSTTSNRTVVTNWNDSTLPACVDVYLETLPEPAARRIEARIGQLGTNTNTFFAALEASVVRTSTRIFLPNRRGYHAR